MIFAGIRKDEERVNLIAYVYAIFMSNSIFEKIHIIHLKLVFSQFTHILIFLFYKN